MILDYFWRFGFIFKLIKTSIFGTRDEAFVWQQRYDEYFQIIWRVIQATEHRHSWVETVQDFLIKLDIKPPMHILEISNFSLNNDLPKLWTTLSNISKFWVSKSFFSIKNWSNLSSFICEKNLIRGTLISKVLYFKKLPNFCRLCL